VLRALASSPGPLLRCAVHPNPAPGKAITHHGDAPPWQKIRTIQLDGKTIKLQIVRQATLLTLRPRPPPLQLARCARCGAHHRANGGW
jgi:hypothetical protein